MLRFGFKKHLPPVRKIMSDNIDVSPPINRSMRELDRSFFHKEFDIVKARFRDPRDISKFIRTHPEDVLNIKGIRNIEKGAPLTTRFVLMTDRLRRAKDAESVLSQDCLNYLKKNEIPLQPHKLVIDYSFWRADQILGAVLPEELLDDIPSGFTQTGHIAHVNLRKEFKPYKNLIGQVILDKNPSIETVVDKVDSIASVYRTFKMEVLAGKKNFVVEHKESNCTFRFDFQNVYWNSRLHAEHERLIYLFKPGEVVFDVMAGVGPFSVPAGKRKVISFANDLNPESYNYLEQNIKLNNVQTVFPSCSDGHEFIRNCFGILQAHRQANNNEIVLLPPVKRSKRNAPTKQPPVTKIGIPKFIHHFVMNLPDSAIDFLGDFNGIYEGQESYLDLPNFTLPKVHVYCFEKFSPDEPEPTEEELEKRVLERIKKQLQYDGLQYEDVFFQLVRKVSPTKPMYRASFTLPRAVAFGSKLENKSK